MNRNVIETNEVDHDQVVKYGITALFGIFDWWFVSYKKAELMRCLYWVC